MNEEAVSKKADINDQPHASRPGFLTWLVLIAAGIAAVVAFFGGFG